MGADVLMENKRGETAMAVAGIGSALASHLRKKKAGNSGQWRKSVTDDGTAYSTGREGRGGRGERSGGKGGRSGGKERGKVERC